MYQQIHILPFLPIVVNTVAPDLSPTSAPVPIPSAPTVTGSIFPEGVAN